MKRVASEAGFTLIEVLVSLALLSILSVYALSAIRLQKDMDLIQGDVARKLEVHAAVNAMVEQLGSMQLVLIPGRDQQYNLVFDGHADRVTFAGLSDGSRIEGGLYRMTFLVNEDHALIGKLEPIKSTGFGPSTEIVLLENVESLALAYHADDGSAGAVQDWSRSDQLPKAIDVGLAIRAEAPAAVKGEVVRSHVLVQLAQ